MSLISLVCPRSSYRRTGRPIIEGKIAVGKFPPAKPLLTNLDTPKGSLTINNAACERPFFLPSRSFPLAGPSCSLTSWCGRARDHGPDTAHNKQDFLPCAIVDYQRERPHPFKSLSSAATAPSPFKLRPSSGILRSSQGKVTPTH